MKVINFQKEMKLLTKEQQEAYENEKICFICKEKFENKYLKDQKYREVRDHYRYTGKYIGAAHSISNLKYSVPEKISFLFHKRSNYDYHVIIKKLAEAFKKQFTSLRNNTEKFITFTVSIEKEVMRIDKNGKKYYKKIYFTHYNIIIAEDLWEAHYQILSIISLKEFIKLNVNSDTMIKNVKHVELNIIIAIVFLNT